MNIRYLSENTNFYGRYIISNMRGGKIWFYFSALPIKPYFQEDPKGMNRCFRQIFFLFTISGGFAKKEGGLIWHGTRLVGVYLMLSGWSADRRKKAFFLSASSYDKQDLAKKATSPLTARRFSL